MIWMLPLTVCVFLIIRKLAFKIKTPLFNPLVISVMVLVPIMIMSQTSYSEYVNNVDIINKLLPYSVVALAFPLYELIPQIKARWKSIIIITFSASIASMITGVSIVFWLGGNTEIAASVLNIAKIKSASARGLSIGAVSHAVGTARCIEVDYNEGAYSSLSLVLCGIMTSLTAPFIFPIMVFIFDWL